MKKWLGVLLVLMAMPALAYHCPMDMKKIDTALAANPTLDAAKMAEFKKLRAEGEAFHQAGKHAESVAAFGKAMKILGIE